jgi:ribosomal protein L11 methyltransferase
VIDAPWVTVSVHPGRDRAAALASLFQAGAESVQELGDNFVTHVPDQFRADALLCAVVAACPDARVDTTPLDVVDWSEHWKDGLRAHRVGELVIAPPWLADRCSPDRCIVIEPAMAFGTGDHATTRGVVRLLAGVIRPGDRVADLGAGSAVLSIAAAKLGASHVAAIEIDPDAIGNAEENVRRNGAADRVVVIEGDAQLLLPLVAPVRVIAANILSWVILELLPAMAAALAEDGRAVVSGMLTSERASMIEAFAAAAWRLEAEDSEDGWWSATIAR